MTVHREATRNHHLHETFHRKFNWPLFLLILNFSSISLIVILFLLREYPILGHDYGGVIPLVLDLSVFFRKNGFAIQWYTPSFGGGFPVFADPNSSQFSLITILTSLFSPLQAVAITACIDIAIGLAASYHLFSKILKFHWTTSVLGSLFFSANGFIIQRVAVGHYAYLVFPVTIVLIVLLLDTSLPWGISGLLFALVVSMIVHQAGYYSLLVSSFSILMVLAMLYIIKRCPLSLKRIFFIGLLGMGLAFLICISKFTAVYAFMRFFPRQISDNYHTNTLQGLFGIFMQLLGTMNLAPLLKLIGLPAKSLTGYMISITGAEYGFWEFDMSISPVVFLIVIIGAYGIIRNLKKYTKLFTSDKRWLAWIVLLITIWITIEFILAKGLVYPFLHKLPFLGSLHVNPRFTAALIFPFVLFACIIYEKWVSRWSDHKAKYVITLHKRLAGWTADKAVLIFLLLNILTLVPYSVYLLIKTDLQDRLFDVTEANAVYAAIQAGDSMSVTDIATRISNTDALFLHKSSLEPYEPIFGYNLENFHPEIHPGSVWEVSDGYYNMTNPSGYVFPEINGTRPFERIKLGDEKNLEAFINYEQPGWKIPLYQQILDWVSGLAFLGVVVTLIAFGATRFVKKFRFRS